MPGRLTESVPPLPRPGPAVASPGGAAGEEQAADRQRRDERAGMARTMEGPLAMSAWYEMYTRILEFDVQQARAGLAAGDGVLLAARDEGHVLWRPLTYLSQLRRKERRRG